ncbi:MAG TPA: DinB family protein [candidate division Zixibacteria bacterium]|nr:DinB family protein [candidate division Zixibacteria bacterium]HEQ98360.1 DinB family protein [candidate division Zixibacteria bacterium]
MGSNNEKILRDYLARMLNWQDAHVNLEKAVENFPPDLMGKKPEGAAHSAWQLLEHMRLAQWDILDFIKNPDYEELNWPDDYWPKDPAPPDDSAWDKSIESFNADLKELQDMARDSSVDLYSKIPHGSGQTILRELLLVADHNTYHLGQIVQLRKMLGAW